MSYQALYRAYRPQTFDKVVGQDTVVKTLQNAIINNKISHAYLFCGPRGTGKTSVARIFAKALNCTNILKSGEPCCECVNCKEISESISPDVVEIDAASNNGVDEIRDIRERVKFLPSGAKYKIYIIDEVHMLSTGAFNALLKILEEPPKHVIFVLATTEPQKLPATIISRCQRYEFKPINIVDIADSLKKVCANEGVEISDEAVQLIGEVADGGMRDALSILDQTISYGNKEISVDDVNTITGSINAEVMSNLMMFIDNKDTNNALDIINGLIKEGKEVNKIVNGMLLYCRDLMLYKSVGPKQLNKYIFDKEKFKELAIKIANTKIIYFIELLCDIQNKIKYTNSPAIYLEIAIIRMASINSSELDVIKRMDELETKLLDTNFSSENFTSGADNERVNNLDNKINKIVSELSKFELPTLSKKVSDIEQIIIDKQSEEELNNNKKESLKISDLEAEYASKFVDIEAKLNAIENGTVLSNDIASNQTISNEEMKLLKQEFEKLKSSINESNKVDYDDSEIKKQIQNIYSELTSIKSNNIQPSIQEDIFDEKRIERIEKSIQEICENQKENATQYSVNNDNEKIQNIESKIAEIESDLKQEHNSVNNEQYVSLDQYNLLLEKFNKLEMQMYENIAENLANKEKQEKQEKSKISKKPSGQLNIFDFGVDKIDDANDFGDLEKVETEETSEINEPDSRTSNEEFIEEKEEILEESKVQNVDVKEYKEVGNDDVMKVQESLFDFDKDSIAVIQKVEDSNINNGTGLFEEIDNNIYIKDNTINETVEEENNSQEIINEEENICEFKPVEDKPIVNEIINQYYDENQHAEVINKTNSSIVIRTEENNNESKELTNEEDNGIIVLEEPDGYDKFAKYNIEDLEKLLYDAQEISAKNDKVRVKEIWVNLTRGIDPQLYPIAELLSEGKIEAVGNKEFVITYADVTKCNEVMRWSFKSQAIRLLYSKLNDTYNYLALPLNVWLDKREEYKSQYQMGIKKAKLTPIIIRGLDVKEIKANDDEKKNETIDQTKKMFGDDIVKIK